MSEQGEQLFHCEASVEWPGGESDGAYDFNGQGDMVGTAGEIGAAITAYLRSVSKTWLDELSVERASVAFVVNPVVKK